MRFLLLGNLLGSVTPLLFAWIDAPGVWPAGLAMMFAGSALGCFAAVSGRGRSLAVAVRMPGLWGVAALLGAVTCAVASSVSFTTLVVSTFLAQLTPVATIALAPVFGERVTRTDGTAVGFAVVGAAFLASAHTGGDHRSHAIGASLALFGAIGSAVILQTQRRFAVDAVPAVAAQAVTLFVGGLVVLPFGSPPDVTLRRVGLVVAVGAVFAASNVCLFRGLRTIRASLAVVARPFGVLVPVVAGPFILHQGFDATSGAGVVLSLGATATAAMQHVRRSATPSPPVPSG